MTDFLSGFVLMYRSDNSVYHGDGECTNTHLLHAHFSAHSACTVTFAHFHACAYTRVAQGHDKGVCYMWVISLHLAFSSLMSHPSLLFLDGHFETIPDFDVHTFLPYLPVLKAQGMRISARAARIVAIWPSPLSTQVMSPKSSTRSLLWTMTRCSLARLSFSSRGSWLWRSSWDWSRLSM